ncbi:MAG: hypothetical protein HYS13_01405 [Planctomycetia bacterium]|nr:hypothetical protein [Planctomycetia bacterium]
MNAIEPAPAETPQAAAEADAANPNADRPFVNLVEFADSRGLSVAADANTGVIRGVKIVGLESKNNRRYRPEAVREAVRLYEGVKVNVNHPKGHPGAPRDYQDRLGCLRNVRFEETGLYGDLHFNPHHPLAEQLVWDALHAPENVGLSHNVQARTARDGDVVVVEEIGHVHSVDLVADPATTTSLFESGVARALSAESAGRLVAWLCSELPELVEALAAHIAKSGKDAELLRERAGGYENLLEREAQIDSLLAELRLPRTPDETRFRRELLELDETEVRRRIRERAARLQAAETAVPATTQPKSKGPEPDEGIGDRRLLASRQPCDDLVRWAKSLT